MELQKFEISDSKLEVCTAAGGIASYCHVVLMAIEAQQLALSHSHQDEAAAGPR